MTPLSVPRWSQEIWRDSFMDYVKAQRVTDAQIARLLRSAADEARKLSDILSGYDGVGAAVRRAQLQQSMEALRQISGEMWPGIERSIKEGLVNASDAALDGQRDMLKYLGDKGLGARKASLLMDSFQTAARQAAENVRSRLINRIPISKDIANNGRWAMRNMEKEINHGIALNRSAKEIARSIVQFIDPNTPGGASFAAMRVGRTELNNAFHTTTSRAIANKPWVEGVKWNLSGSHPRPDECNDYAEGDPSNLGTGIFEPNKVPGKPHPNCLCFITIITVSPEKFADNLVSGRYDAHL